MKKFMSIFIVVILSMSVITGCGNKAAKTGAEIKTKTEAELKAELKAEIKAELEAEAKAAKEVESEIKIEGQTTVAAKTEGTTATKQDLPKDKEVNNKVELLTFDEVYDGENLVKPINYFNIRFDEFEESAKNDFAQSIYNEYRQKLRNYNTNDLENLESDIERYGPVPPRTLDEYYTYYSMKDSTIDLNQIDGWIANIIKQIENDELLTVAATFYATEGYVEGISFEGTIKPEYRDQFEKVHNVVGEDSNYDYFYWKATDKPFHSDLASKYASVYIDEPAVLELFENENVYKTNIWLPINNVIGEPNQSDIDNHIEPDSIFSDEPFDISIFDGFTNETINGTLMDFSKYSAAVVPMYNGQNTDLLKSYSATFHGSTSDALYFAAFGEFKNVTLTYYETNDSEGEEMNIGDVVNGYVEINIDLPYEESYVRVSADVKLKNGEPCWMATNLDRVRKIEEYDVVTME